MEQTPKLTFVVYCGGRFSCTPGGDTWNWERDPATHKRSRCTVKRIVTLEHLQHNLQLIAGNQRAFEISYRWPPRPGVGPDLQIPRAIHDEHGFETFKAECDELASALPGDAAGDHSANSHRDYMRMFIQYTEPEGTLCNGVLDSHFTELMDHSDSFHVDTISSCLSHRLSSVSQDRSAHGSYPGFLLGRGVVDPPPHTVSWARMSCDTSAHSSDNTGGVASRSAHASGHRLCNWEEEFHPAVTSLAAAATAAAAASPCRQRPAAGESPQGAPGSGPPPWARAAPTLMAPPAVEGRTIPAIRALLSFKSRSTHRSGDAPELATPMSSLGKPLPRPRTPRPMEDALWEDTDGSTASPVPRSPEPDPCTPEAPPLRAASAPPSNAGRSLCGETPSSAPPPPRKKSLLLRMESRHLRPADEGWSTGRFMAESRGEVYEPPQLPSTLQRMDPASVVKIRELGRGQFASVYLARWKGVEVAMKELHGVDERSVREMFNEAESLAGLRHPCIIAFYGVISDMSCPAGLIEYMQGGSLRKGLTKLESRMNHLPVDRRSVRAAIALQAARGMEYLHSLHTVHFDMKCDNLLCDLRDVLRPVVKIADLGLSKQKEQTTVSGNMRGTLPWMAPELFPTVQLEGSLEDRVTEKVDVFSFGIVLWEIWTYGAQPYPNLSMPEILAGLMGGTLRPAVPADCEPEWEALMSMCWATEPVDRPEFEEIAARLESLVELWRGDAPGDHSENIRYNGQSVAPG